MKKYTLLAFSLAACLLACDSESSAPSPSVGNAELGIAEFRTTQTGDHLELVGVDVNGAVVATLRLRVGHVEIPEDALAGQGREFVAEIGGKQTKHASVGMTPLELPAIDERDFDRFFSDPYVSHLLAGFGVEVTVRSGELVLPADTTYSHGGWDCSGFIPGCNNTQYTSCCIQHADGSGNRNQKVLCGNITPQPSVAIRSCKAPDVMTACGLAGSAGCAVCWSTNYDPSEYTYWINYSSSTDTCSIGQCWGSGLFCQQDSECCSNSCDEQNGSCD